MSPKHAKKGLATVKFASSHGEHIRPAHEPPIVYVTDSDAWLKQVNADTQKQATDSQPPDDTSSKSAHSSDLHQPAPPDSPSQPNSKQPKFWLWIFSSILRTINILVAIALGATAGACLLIGDGLLLADAGLNPDNFILPSTVAGLLAIFWATGIIVAWNHFRKQYAR